MTTTTASRPPSAADTSRPVLYVIIPVLNESANVERLCGDLADMCRIAAAGFESRIIIIDDGSTDDTAEQFLNSGLGSSLVLLKHETNQGPGAAFRTAFTCLSRRLADQDLVMTMEGDNTSQTGLFQNMLVRFRQGADVILASPYAPGGSMTNVARHRLALSHAANLLARAVLGLWKIRTLSSFYRLHAGSIIRRLQRVHGDGIIESDGFEWAVEMLHKLHLAGAGMVEVPMKMDLSHRKGKTKMKIFRTIKGYFRVFLNSKQYSRLHR